MYAGIIGLIVLVLGGGYLAMQGSDEMATDDMMKDDVAHEGVMKEEVMKQDAVMDRDMMMKKDGEAMEGDSMMKKDEVMMKDEDAMMEKKQGSIESYSPEKLALANSGKVLLFFHASWCPICRQLDAEAIANPNIVPEGVHVLKVDYDTATTLKQKYGVTVQHTFVQVDANGASVQKFSDASNYASVFSRVK